MLFLKEEIMQYFDLHCDTLYRAVMDNSDFVNDSYHISVNKAPQFDKWKQLFAIWIPDEIKGDKATDLFIKAVNKFRVLLPAYNNIDMMFAVENASMLNGDIRNIELLTLNKVRYVTLTWNGENELGCGAFSNADYGIYEKKKNVVKELEHNNICIDVSHASDKLFYDVLKIAEKPFLATHSNSRTITDHKRNLTDDQFKIIRDIGGVVGLNFYKGFLNDDEDKASIDDIVRHAEHFLNLDGENTLAIGSDFDGADMPIGISSIFDITAVYERFLREFGAKLTKKVFFDNANMYLTNFDNN